MELDQVRHVLAVVKYRTFLEASFQLNRSQSSLSKSIRRLEEELGISIPFAYRIIRQMNEELAKTGCITISGRIDRKFFHEKFYGTRTETTRKSNGMKSSR